MLRPDVGEALSKLPQPSTPPTDRVQALRNAAATYEKKLMKRIGPAPSDMDEFYHEIDLRDGTKSSLKIHKPRPSRPGPLVVLFFSGAFIAGSNDQLSDIARASVSLFGATVVSTSYRLAPEHKFPTAVEDSIDSIRWVADNATSALLSSNPSQGFLIGGASSGGNLAAVVSRYVQREPLPYPITGQWVSVANLMDENSVPQQYKEYFISREQNAYAPILDEVGVKLGALAIQGDSTSELRYPVNSSTLTSDQPKTFFQICGKDPYRDDGLIYEELLKSAGVSTKVAFYAGCPHGFWLVIPDSDSGRKALVDIVLGFGWLLERSVTLEMAVQMLRLDI